MDVLQDDLNVKFDKPLPVAQDRVVLPPNQQIDLEPKLPAQPIGNTVIPTTRIRVTVTFADLFEIENNDSEAFVLQPCRCRGNQAGLAGTIRRNHVRVIAGDQCVEQQIVCGSTDIPRSQGVQRRTNIEKLGGFRRVRRIRIVQFLGHCSRFFARSCGARTPRLADAYIQCASARYCKQPLLSF